MAVIFHIGPPKTGTTLVQRALLSTMPNTLSPSSGSGDDRSLRRDVSRAIKRNGAFYWDTASGRALMARLIARVEAAQASGVQKNLVISHEQLASPYLAHKVGANPAKRARRHVGPEMQFVLHLRRMTAHLGSVAEVRVMYGVRAQSSWLCSMYSQVAFRRDHPGQADLVAWIDRFLDDRTVGGFYFLDYALWFGQLAAVVGRENVFPLVIERADSAAYWVQIGRALDFPIDAGEYAHHAAENQYNRRSSVDGGEWRLRYPRGYSPDSPRRFVSSRLGLRVSALLASGRRESSRSIYSDRVGNVPEGGQSQPVVDVIRLEADLARRVRALYSASNRRMSRILGFDLEAAGY
jgi:hypothetical protein